MPDVKDIPIIFVHGAWHGAWCWEEYFLDYFKTKGFNCRAIDLRQHGKMPKDKHLRWIRIDDYIKDLKEAIEKTGKSPILVGHSMGGLVVQKYLENHNVPAAVLLAPVPRKGVLRTALRILRRHPIKFLKALFTLSLYPVIETPELSQEWFFSNKMPLKQVRKFHQCMQDESFFAFMDMLIFRLPKPKKVNTPVLVLGGEDDEIFTCEQIKSLAKSYHNNPDNTIIHNLAHDMMLESNWKEAADKIINWLSKKMVCEDIEKRGNARCFFVFI